MIAGNVGKKTYVKWPAVIGETSVNCKKPQIARLLQTVTSKCAKIAAYKKHKKICNSNLLNCTAGPFTVKRTIIKTTTITTIPIKTT